MSVHKSLNHLAFDIINVNLYTLRILQIDLNIRLRIEGIRIGMGNTELIRYLRIS